MDKMAETEVGHSYLDYRSWPSSLVATVRREKSFWLGEPRYRIDNVNVGDEVVIEVSMKTENVPSDEFAQAIARWVKEGEGRVGATPARVSGSTDWRDVNSRGKGRTEITKEIDYLSIQLTAAGGGTERSPSITKFDNLRVLLNGKVMVEDSFSNYTPYLAGIGIPAVGAVLTKWAGWW